jgi:hypothetical protein
LAACFGVDCCPALPDVFVSERGLKVMRDKVLDAMNEAERYAFAIASGRCAKKIEKFIKEECRGVSPDIVTSSLLSTLNVVLANVHMHKTGCSKNEGMVEAISIVQEMNERALGALKKFCYDS